MVARERSGFVIVGAGAAGLMAARELARAGKRVVILEARERCGGRIDPLPAEDFGYPAEGGAEFVHGAAALTRGLMREAGLSLSPAGGTRWRAANGVLAPDERATPYAAELRRALGTLSTDLPVAEFLARNFAGSHY
ncbi:MAG TPA: FAD-dependent oxidoreductase, partial [Stellaceae bacterium]|nr:FAD-dependent oxidoreductase [Stellaceae bacterium]